MRGLLLALCIGCGAADERVARDDAAELTLPPRPQLEAMGEDVARRLGPAVERLEAELLDERLPDSRRAETIAELGRHYHAYRLWSAAEACYRGARRLDPARDDWTYHLGVLLQQRGRLEEAVEVLSEITEPSFEVLLRTGTLRLELGRPTEAIALFERVLEERSEEPAAHAGLGRALLANGEPAQALAHLERALELQPTASSLHFLLAKAKSATGDAEAAARHLEAQGPTQVSFPDPRIDAIAQLASGAGIDLRRGDAALFAGDSESAVDAYRRAVESSPRNPSARHSLAAALAKAGRLEESRAEFLRALELDQDNPTLLVGLAATQLELGDTEAALDALRRTVELDPGSVDYRLRLATAAERAGRPQVALGAFEAALQLDGMSVAALVGRSRALAALGRELEARRELEGLVEGHPHLAEARFGLASLLARSGDYAAAATHYRWLVDAAPRNPEYRLLEATALVLAGQYRDAGERLEAGVTALPEEAELAHTLARLLATCPDEEIRDGKRALRLARTAFDGENSLERAETVAMALAETGQFEEAVLWQERVVEQARLLGADSLLPRARRNLERYRKGEPATPPWYEHS